MHCGTVAGAENPVVPRSAPWKNTTENSLFRVFAQADPERKYEFEKLVSAATSLADNCLRRSVTLPANSTDPCEPATVNADFVLPACSCAFRGCLWQYVAHDRKDDREDRQHVEHPWDRKLRAHILAEHRRGILEVLLPTLPEHGTDEVVWDVYKQALAVQERQGFPLAHVAVDRRAFEYTMRVYNDDRVRSLICCACACICLDTGGPRSHIEFVGGGWLLQLPGASLRKNFSFQVFSDRYCQSGPLAFRGATERCADFSDWQLHLAAEVVDEAKKQSARSGNKGTDDVVELGTSTPLLCCPEELSCSMVRRDVSRLGSCLAGSVALSGFACLFGLSVAGSVRLVRVWFRWWCSLIALFRLSSLGSFVCLMVVIRRMSCCV